MFSAFFATIESNLIEGAFKKTEMTCREAKHKSSEKIREPIQYTFAINDDILVTLQFEYMYLTVKFRNIELS